MNHKTKIKENLYIKKNLILHKAHNLIDHDKDRMHKSTSSCNHHDFGFTFLRC